MSNISISDADLAPFEAQFARTASAPATAGQLRVRGWMIVLGASVVLWTLIGVGIALLVRAL